MSDGRVPPTLTISIDTEEDGWGRYDRTEYSVRNIERLPELQEIFERWGARPTYMVNLPPLSTMESVAVLGELAEHDAVEIGAQCHSWNTPPFSEEHEGDVSWNEQQSLMSSLPLELNRAKIRTICASLEKELDVRPTSFRAGRWGYGPSVSRALADEGFLVDSSVTPFIDWSDIGGPDFSSVPCHPYRFDPDHPFDPDPRGSMVELPTTVGFLSGEAAASGRRRSKLEKSLLGRARLVGILDRMGLLARRWLSPETSSTRELRQLARRWVRSGNEVLAFTFHSSTLLPGATPFVRDRTDLERFYARIDRFLGFCSEEGYRFGTVTEVGRRVMDSQQVGDGARR